MNHHEADFERWLNGKAKPWLSAKRGRYAAMARYLGVSRQTVSRWFKYRARNGHSLPGWAGVAMNIYLHRRWQSEAVREARVVTAQADSRFRNLEFVRGSEDKLVTRQADNEEEIRQTVKVRAA